MLKSIFQEHDDDPKPKHSIEGADLPYRIWFIVAIVVSFGAIWSTNHYQLVAKIAWTITAPGFTLSQTWNNRGDLLSRAFFGIFFVVHLCLMELLFPHFPVGRYGYILVAAIVEIMTLGLAYQVWMRLRSKPDSNNR